jgi:geranylgeranyl diphosphate synthase type I
MRRCSASARQSALAFQIQDDILGIWGDPAVTGKAAGNDILRKQEEPAAAPWAEPPATVGRATCTSCWPAQ